ncbi:hypothetical protein Tco_0138225 [Tanacetum coccineum]
MQSPFPQSPPKGSSQTEGEHIRKDNGKKALSSEEAVKESTESDSDDDETHLSGSMVKSSRIKKVKKFDFVIEDGKHIHLTEEQINQQKKIEKYAKAKAAKHERSWERKYTNLTILITSDISTFNGQSFGTVTGIKIGKTLISLSPRNCIPPEVLLRVSMHSACSTSENALEKPLDIRKLDNSSYQALGACFKPYKAFLKR